MSKVIKKGIKDCHARGVDSVVLGEVNGKLQRAFIAREGHTLSRLHPLAVGFHAHHCDITIEVVSGSLFNVNAAVGRGYLSSLPSTHARVRDYMELDTYEYHSPILNDGKGHFEKVSERPRPIDVEFVAVDASSDPLALAACIVHTIWIPTGQPCTWVVTEGEEDPEYHPFVYTNRDLRHETLEGMYRPMEDAEADTEIERVKALLAQARARREEVRLANAAARAARIAGDPLLCPIPLALLAEFRRSVYK
jgi:hypothetical protein